MSRGQQTFRQGDVTRALRAVRKAGVEVLRVEVDRDGEIVVVVGNQDNNAKAAGRQVDRSANIVL
jgi:hypothetical protein